MLFMFFVNRYGVVWWQFCYAYWMPWMAELFSASTEGRQKREGHLRLQLFMYRYIGTDLKLWRHYRHTYVSMKERVKFIELNVSGSLSAFQLQFYF